MFSCITGFAMYQGTHKSWMTIYDNKRPNTGDNGEGRNVITYGGYLLEKHGPIDPNEPDSENIRVDVLGNDGVTPYPIHLHRERCDHDLTTLVAQCLCEEPKDRPSMKKLLEFTTYWLRYYSDPENCTSDWQKDAKLGPTGATSTNLFRAPVSIRDSLKRDRPNSERDLKKVSCSLSIIPTLSHQIMGGPGPPLVSRSCKTLATSEKPG
jgi:hypothetical protein